MKRRTLAAALILPAWAAALAQDPAPARWTVVDGATGAAVPGAVVALGPEDSPPRGTVVADAKGAFDLPPRGAGGRVTVTAPGFLPEVAAVRPGESGIVRLVRGATLFGKVTSPDGKPVADARVVAVPPRGHRRETECVAFTGADGRYEMTAVPPGDWSVFVLDDRWTTPEAATLGPYEDWNPLSVSVVGGERRTVDRGAVPMTRVRGRVVDAGGRPYAGARVEAWESQGNLWTGVSDRLPRATSRADGTFEVGWFPGRSALLRAVAGDVDSNQAGLDPGAGEVVLTLRPLGFADLVVRDEEGGPVAGTSVRFWFQSGCFGANYATFTTGADGRVHAGPLPVMELRADVESPDFVRRTVDVKVAETSEAEIVLARGRRVSGTIAPLPAEFDDASVTVHALPAPGSTDGETDADTARPAADGSFRSRPLPPGRYSVSVRVTAAGGRAWTGSAPVDAGFGALTVPLQAQRTGASRRGTVRVVGPDDRPVPRATLHAHWRTGDAWTGASADVRDGTATLDLPASVQSLHVTVRDAADAAGAPLPLAAVTASACSFADDDPTVHLAAALAIGGTVRRGDGAPLAGLGIRAVPVCPAGRVPGPGDRGSDTPSSVPSDAFRIPAASCRSQADGSFVLRGLAAGEYRLESVAPERLTVDAPIVAAGTHDVTLTVGAGAHAAVRVLDADGKPVAGARVIVRASADPNSESSGAHFAEADGVVHVHGVAPGTDYGCFIDAPRERTDLGTVVLPRWRPRDTEVRLPREFVFAGTVVDGRGAEVPRVTVWARPVTASGPGRWSETRSGGPRGQGGAFSIPHLAAAEIDVAVVRSGGPPETVQRMTVGAAPARLLYEPGPSIAIDVQHSKEITLGNAGMPDLYRAVLVEGEGAAARVVAEQVADEGERVSFDRLRDGARYALWLTRSPTLQHWNFDAKCAFLKDLVPGRTYSLVAAAGPGIEGRIVVEGRPLPGRVTVTATLGALTAEARVEGDRFVLHGLVAGTWTVSASADEDGRVLVGSAEIDAGARGDVVLRVR